MPEGAQPGGEAAPAPQDAPGQGVAPDPGQGTEGTDSGNLYGEILNAVPHEFHEALTEKLKAKDADFTKRFQSVSEQWKPYEELGLQDADPELVGGWMNLNQALDAASEGNEEAKQSVYQWWEQLGDSLEFFDSEGGGEGQESQPEDLLDMTPQQLEEIISSRVADAVNPLVEQQTQAQQQQALKEAEGQVAESLSSIRQANPNLTDEHEQQILALAYQFGEDSEDPIAEGYKQFQSIRGEGESNLFGEKANQPRPAEGAGMPDTSLPQPNSDNVKELAMERLRQAQAT